MKQKLFSLNDLNKDFWKKVLLLTFFVICQGKVGVH